MAQFTVRVELHGATSADYDRLHIVLAAYGMSKTIPGIDNTGAAGVWALPTGEYDYTAETTAKALRETVKILADAVKLGAWVLVTQVADRNWTTAKIQG